MGSKNVVLLSSFFVLASLMILSTTSSGFSNIEVHARTFPILPPNVTVVPGFLTVEIPAMAIQILKTTIATVHFNVIISPMAIQILKTLYVGHLHYVKI